MEYCFSDRLAKLQGNAIREIFKLLDRGDVISFAGGNPDPNLLPVELVGQIAGEVIAEKGKKILQYGLTEGYAPLRESVAALVADCGIHCQSKDVLIISGGQQGIDLACKAFVNKGDTVLVEKPTYLAALQILRTYQANIVGVDTDGESVTPENLEAAILEHHPKMIYLVPTFQNPTGRTFSAERRKKLVEIATKYHVMVVEDDPYRNLRYTGEALDSMKSLDTEGNIIYVTSFSKTISPGLRVGAAIAAPEVLAKLVVGKQAVDVHTSLLSQAIVDEYLRRGYFYPQIDRMTPKYAEKMNCMLDALAKYLPEGVKFTHPEGGLFIWGELPEHIDALKLMDRTIERKVAFIPGTHFFSDGSGANTIRLNFSSSTCEQIEQGVKILGEEIAAF